MANAVEQNQFDIAVRLIEPGDSVVGGAGAPINQPLQALANRTLWLKNQTATLHTETAGKADAATAVNAGSGLTGGGRLDQNRTIALGAPGQITAQTKNAVQETGHTHAIDTATTSRAGIVQLSSATDSDSEELAATPKAVKAAYDKAVGAKASLATNTVPGLVKLINNLTSGGTDAALTAEQGKVLATALENKSDKEHIHTAAEIKQAVVDLFQPQQHSGTGYQRLPNGFAFQWGVVNEKWAGERPQKITFPVSFTACYGVFLGTKAEGTTQNIVLIDSTWGVQAMTNVSFEAVWNTWSSGNASHLRGFYWIAIGLL